MANSLGSLVVRLGLDAADYTTGLQKAAAGAARFAQGAQDSFRSVGRSAKEGADGLNYFRDGLLAVGSALGIRELIQLSDEYQNVNARLKIFAASNQDLANIQAQVFKVAQETRQSLGATSDLYYQLANATQEAGLSQKAIIDIVSGVNKALILSGSTGSSAKGAIIQLSQALAAGKLRGQEFNTVNEQGNRILRALGEGLGKTTGQLREMANDGKITTDVFVYGFTRGLATIDKEFAGVPVTVSGAFQQATNELQKFVGTVLQSANEANNLALIIQYIAKNVDVLTTAVIGFVAVKILTTVGNLAAAFLKTTTEVVVNAVATRDLTVATVAATEAEIAHAVALRAGAAAAIAKSQASLAAAEGAAVQTVATAAAASASSQAIVAATAVEAIATANLTAKTAALAEAKAAVATRAGLAARALGILGGPIGTIITVLGLAATAWEIYELKATKANENAAKSTAQATDDIISSLQKQYVKLKTLNDAASGNAPATNRNEAAQLELNRLQQEIANEQDLVRALGGQSTDKLEVMQHQYAVIAASLDRINKEEIVKTIRERSEVAGAKLKELATDAEKVKTEIQDLANSIGSDHPLFPELKKRIIEKAHKAQPGEDDRKKILDGQIKAVEANLAREKDLQSAYERFLSDSHQQGLVSVKDYYDKLEVSRALNLNRQLQDYDDEIAAAENFYKSSKKNTDKQEALNTIDTVNAKKQNLLRDSGIQEQALARQRIVDEQAFSDALGEVNARILELNGNMAEAAKIRFDAANRIFNSLLAKTDSPDAKKALEQQKVIEQQIIVQAKLADETKKYGLIVDDLQLEQQRLNIARDSGASTELSSLYALSDLNAKYAASLRERLVVLQEIAATSKDPSDILKAKQLQVQLEQLESQTELVAKKFNDLFASELSTALQDVVNGTKNVKDAFFDMARSIDKAIVQIAANNLGEAIFGKGGTLSGAGNLLSNIFKGGGTTKQASDFVGPPDPNASTDIVGWISKLFGDGGKAVTAAASTATAAAETLASATAMGTAAVGLTTSAGLLTASATALSAAAVAMSAGSVGSSLGSAFSAIGPGAGDMLGSLFGGGLPFPMFAGGTDFAPGGMALVGERGPEIVNLPRGSQVIPNDVLTQKRNERQLSITQHINIMPGANTQSGRQAAALVRDAVLRSVKDR